MTASKKSTDGESPAPRAALPKKAKTKAKPTSNSLIDRASESVKTVSRDLHPGHSVHPRGHSPDEAVRILAHIYQPWADDHQNGSGMFAVAHWAKFLEVRGVSAVEVSPKDSVGFTRGLTHR